MKAEIIDLSDYVMSGEGANAQSFDCISDPTMMLKLYNKNFDYSSIITEYELAHQVYAMGVKTPPPGKLVTDGERTGILFKRIAGKRSYSRIFSQEPDKVEEFSRDYAKQCRELHGIHCPKGTNDVKISTLKLLEADNLLSAEQKMWVRRFVEGLPDCDTAIHGDMHFGNALTTIAPGSHASEPHDFYFIDLGYFGCGYPLFDLGMTYSICNIADEEFLMHDMHFGRDIGARAWEAFRDEYFFGPGMLSQKYFGKDATKEDVDRGLEPFCFLKLLLVEYNVGSMPPNYVGFFMKTAEKICLTMKSSQKV